MSVLSVCGMGNIKGKKASSRLLSDSDQWASSSWHTVCSEWTSGDLFPHVWFTTLNCGHLISACSQRYKKTLAFADKAKRSALLQCSKGGSRCQDGAEMPLQTSQNIPGGTDKKNNLKRHCRWSCRESFKRCAPFRDLLWKTFIWKKMHNAFIPQHAVNTRLIYG